MAPAPKTDLRLSQLLAALGPGLDLPRVDPRIAAVHYRAQEVIPGGLFVAVPGLRHDGADFIGRAIANQAAAIVTQKVEAARQNTGVPVVVVPDARRAMAAIASRFYGRPSEKLVMVGITGTNGKTTTAYLIESILFKAGLAAGVIGTIDYRFGGHSFKNPVTTPESADLQRILAQMLAAGTTHVVMEVSSHAIDLHRIDSCFMDVGVFTNLSQDHLDYHGDMSRYWECKKSFFSRHLTKGPKKEKTRAVVNLGDPRAGELTAIPGLAAVTVGLGAPATLWSPHLRADLSGITGQINTPGGVVEIASPLLGDFNRENLLCATGAGFALGIPAAAIEAGLNSLKGVPGRLEAVANTNGKHIFVDYAHTPDALENVLAAVRVMTRGRLICIFGCGGDRDQAKRPQMGAIAAAGADVVVVTSDNPRSENPQAIIGQILAGILGSGLKELDPRRLSPAADIRGFVAEPDRLKAIGIGLSAAGAQDVVVIAGKGHEDYQIIGDQRRFFDDRLAAQKILAGGA